MINKNEYIKSMSEAIGSCPPATQDVTLNLKNRQDCIDKANYGPANPNEQDEAYWQKKADQFKTTIKIGHFSYDLLKGLLNPDTYKMTWIHKPPYYFLQYIRLLQNLSSYK